MSDEAREKSALAWVIDNQFITENQKPLDFGTHRFMIEPYNDIHPDQVVKKSAQVGWSTLAIYKALHAAGKLLMNIIYTLPTKSVLKDFVFPKVDPIIEGNPEIKKMLTQNSADLKKIGDRFMYFRGTSTERAAITTAADLLVHDELDRSDQKVINVFRSRLQASEIKWRWRFSNPSVPGYGVDLLYSQSDQKHWFVTCRHCGWERYMDDEPNDDFYPHYLDMQRKIFACGKCGDQNNDECLAECEGGCTGEIYDNDRARGRWVAKYPKRADYPNPGDGRRGYWISQLMAPWVSAAELVDIYNDVDTTPEYWYNFVLGKAYQNADLAVNRETILRATSPGVISTLEVAIGVDNGVVRHFVCMTAEGVFRYGETKDTNDIERLLLQYPNSKMVIDANPYPDWAVKLVKKYPGRVFVHYYVQDKKNIGTIQWGEGEDRGVVQSDRTKILDQVAGEIVRRDLCFVMKHSEMETYISHWAPLYRTIEVNAKQQKRGIWLTQENRPDHLAHATVYARVALYKVATGFAGGIIPNHLRTTKAYREMTVPGVSTDGTGRVKAMVDPLEAAEATTLSKRSRK